MRCTSLIYIYIHISRERDRVRQGKWMIKKKIHVLEGVIACPSITIRTLCFHREITKPSVHCCGRWRLKGREERGVDWMWRSLSSQLLFDKEKQWWSEYLCLVTKMMETPWKEGKKESRKGFTWRRPLIKIYMYGENEILDPSSFAGIKIKTHALMRNLKEESAQVEKPNWK